MGSTCMHARVQGETAERVHTHEGEKARASERARERGPAGGRCVCVGGGGGGLMPPLFKKKMGQAEVDDPVEIENR